MNLTVASPGRTLGVFRRAVEPDSEVVLALPPEGGEVVVDLGGRTLAQIPGRALTVFRDGVPFAEGSVLGWSVLHREATTTEPSAPLRFPGLAPGAYEVCLVPIGAYPQWLLGYREESACAAAGLGAFQELRLDLSGVE